VRLRKLRLPQISLMLPQTLLRPQTWLFEGLGTWWRRSSVTVTATLTVLALPPFGSDTSVTEHTRSSLTPIFLQAARKLSTLRRHFAADSFGTAGEGTWMEETERGETWLAMWQRTTPSVREEARSSPRDTLSLDSIWCLRWCMCVSCTAVRSCSLLTVKLLLGWEEGGGGAPLPPWEAAGGVGAAALLPPRREEAEGARGRWEEWEEEEERWEEEERVVRRGELEGGGGGRSSGGAPALPARPEPPTRSM